MQEPAWWRRSLLQLGVISACCIAIVGVVVLAGWVLELPRFRSLGSQAAPMMPLMAAALLITGAAMVWSRLIRSWARFSWLAGAGMIAVAALTALEYLFGWNLGVDGLLFPRQIVLQPAQWPGRLSVYGTLSLLLLGVAMLCVQRNLTRIERIGRWMAILTLMLSLAVLIGQLYAIDSLYTQTLTLSDTAHTTVALLILSLSYCCLYPSEIFLELLVSDTIGGLLTRWLIPLFTLLPIGIGWVVQFGKHEGLYDSTFAGALLVTMTSAALALLAYRFARAFHRFEIQRRQLSRSLTITQAENQRLAMIARHTSNAAVITDSAGLIEWVNESFSQITGYGRDEVIGKKPGWLLQGPDTDPQTIQLMRDRLNLGEGFRVEILNYRKDGRPIWLDIEIQPIYDEQHQLTQFMAIERDITERKAVERRLEEAWRLFQNGPAVLFRWEVTPPFRVLSVSPNVRQYGYTDDDILSGRITYLDLIHPDDRMRVVEEIALFQELLPRLPFTEQHYRVVRADGAVRDVYDFTIGQFDAQGRLIYADGYLIDITERRRAEAERQRLEAQFLQAQKMEAIGRLAGGVAHDFNNVLTVINGYSELILDMMWPGDANYSLVLEIQAAGHRGSDLARQLLTLSRKQPLQMRVIDLNTIIRDMLGMLNRLIGETVDLVPRLAPDLHTAWGDVSQFEQIILNLAVNARDAMPDGGQITITTWNWSLAAEAQHPQMPPGEYVCLAVSDTGTGIDPAIRDQIFEPFFTTKDSSKGTGLGLATVYGIVQQHNGMITVESEPGRGTTFTIVLPQIAEPTGDEPRARAPGTRPRGQETILLVEDDDGVRTLTSRMLRQYGYTVIEACDGPGAIQSSLHQFNLIDLLITDVILPQMSGRLLAETLAQSRPALPVVYISGYPDSDPRRQQADGASAYFLPKPFTAEQLLAMVRQALDDSPRG